MNKQAFDLVVARTKQSYEGALPSFKDVKTKAMEVWNQHGKPFYESLPEGRARQAFTGGAIGTGLGIGVGGISGLLRTPQENEGRIGNMFGGALRGGIAGGAVGAGVGALTPEWLPYATNAATEGMLDGAKKKYLGPAKEFASRNWSELINRMYSVAQ